jgi:hypothetical protein
VAALESLAERLNVPADQLSGLKGLDEKKLAAIDAIVGDALTAEKAAFTKALEDSLDFLPRLVRPIAKKMFGV